MSKTKLKEVIKELQKNKIACAHLSFSKKQNLPYVIWTTDEVECIFADGSIAFKLETIALEVYFDKNDTETTKKVEEILNATCGTYETSGETYIEDEGICEVIYYFAGD